MFGQGGTRPGTHDVTVGDDLGDDQWHQIDIERNKQHVKIIIDITRKFLTAERLQRYQNITIAGLPLSIKSNTSVSLINPSSSLPPVSLTGSTFKGCMEDATFDNINIFKATKEKSKDIRVLGKLWPKCADDAEYYPAATLSKSTSYIKLDTVNGQDANLKFKFRTFDHTGVLVHYSFGSSTKRWLVLELMHGRLIFRYAFQNLNINTIISRKYITYADGLWHNIQFNLTSKGVAIRANNETAQKFLNSSAQFRNLFQNSTLSIGSSLKDKLSMKGCVKEMQLNGKDIDFKSTTSQDVSLDQCYLTDLCFINPCLHQGVCQQHNNTIQCDCTNTGYFGSRCQSISTSTQHKILSTQNTLINTNSSSMLAGTVKPHQTNYNGTKASSTLPATIKPSPTTSKVIKTIPVSIKQDSTVRPSTGTADKQPNTLASFTKLKTIFRNPSLTSTAKTSMGTMRKNISTVKPSQFISPITKQTSGQPKQLPMTPTRQILTGKPKRVIPTTNKKISTVKPNQSTAAKSKQTLSTPTKQSLSATRRQTLITQLKQATTSPKKVTITDQVKQVTTPTNKQASTGEPKRSVGPFTTKIPPLSTMALNQPTPQLNLPTEQKPTRHSLLPSHRSTQRITPPTTENPTDKVNTGIIIIDNSNNITKVGFNKNQLLVYLFLLIVFMLFVGLVVIISIKMSYMNSCPCRRRFQMVNGSLPSQDSIEMSHQQRKDASGAVRVKNDRPSSVNDSGIDRSESGTDSNRSSAEVQDDDAISNSDDLGTTLRDHRDLETSPDDTTEGFLILQEDPSLYTQKSFGWTILSSSNTIRHCRTSTRDLIHAANENKPRAFRPTYYADSKISDDVRVDVEDDVSGDVTDTQYRNPSTKYRELATSDCSSLDNVSIDMEQYNSKSGEECLVF